MNMFFLIFCLPMILLSKPAQAEEIWKHCGVLLKLPAGLNMGGIEEKIYQCDVGVEFLIKGAPAVLEDQRRFHVSNESIEDLLIRTEFFKKKSNEYKLVVGFDLQEAQFFLKTMGSQTILLKKNGVRGVLGVAAVQVGANPYMLWPSSEIRDRAVKKYLLTGAGLILDCFYGHAGISEKPLSVTMSGCLPRSRDPADLSTVKIQRMLESLQLAD